MTKSATSPRAAADLIIRATSAPNTYIFSELLATPQIQSLSTSSEYSNHLTLLQIFSYGTYTDYLSTPSLPPLTPPQLLKLRQLTFLTLAKIPSNLTYTNLLSALSLETPRELEDLVISTIYAGLVTATLDPYNQLILVSSVSPLRDLPPNTIPTMLSTLAEWSLRCNSTLLDLEKQIASIKAAATKRSKEEKEWAEKVEKLADSKPEKTTFEEERKGTTTSGSGNGSGVGTLGLGRPGVQDIEARMQELARDVHSMQIPKELLSERVWFGGEGEEGEGKRLPPLGFENVD